MLALASLATLVLVPAPQTPAPPPAAPQDGAPQDQTEPAADPKESQATEPEPISPEEARRRFLEMIDGKEGPLVGDLGRWSEIDVPEGFVFSGSKGTQHFLEMNENPTAGNEMGLVLPWGADEEASWFVCFSYVDSGYVKDDEKDKLDADELLKGLREGNASGNEMRKKRGWQELELVGWRKPPFYDPETHNLTWATRVRAGDHESVNWSTRFLGRSGYMTVDLVTGAEGLEPALPKFQELVKSFRYKSGQRYAEFRTGDKIAEYGLGALILGGAGAVAAKTGLLAKFWKLLVVGGVAIAGFVRRLWGRIAGTSGEKSKQGTTGG